MHKKKSVSTWLEINHSRPLYADKDAVKMPAMSKVSTSIFLIPKESVSRKPTMHLKKRKPTMKKCRCNLMAKFLA